VRQVALSCDNHANTTSGAADLGESPLLRDRVTARVGRVNE
jgi:hypothetical protein